MKKFFFISAFLVTSVSAQSFEHLVGNIADYKFEQPFLHAMSKTAEGHIGDLTFQVAVGGPLYGQPYRYISLTFKSVFKIRFRQADDVWKGYSSFYDQIQIIDLKSADKKILNLKLPSRFAELFQANRLLEYGKPAEAGLCFKKEITLFITHTLGEYEAVICEFLNSGIGSTVMVTERDHDVKQLKNLADRFFMSDKNSPQYKHIQGIASAFVKHGEYLNEVMLEEAKIKKYSSIFLIQYGKREEIYEDIFSERMGALIKKAEDDLLKIKWTVGAKQFENWAGIYHGHSKNRYPFSIDSFAYYSYSDHEQNWHVIGNRIYPGNPISIKECVRCSSQIRKCVVVSNIENACYQMPQELLVLVEKYPDIWRGIKKGLLQSILVSSYKKSFSATSFYEWMYRY